MLIQHGRSQLHTDGTHAQAHTKGGCGRCRWKVEVVSGGGRWKWEVEVGCGRAKLEMEVGGGGVQWKPLCRQ